MAEVGLIWADDADLSAIYEYVENQRPLISQYPDLQAKIEDFEKWYQALTYWDVHIMINDTLAEAARRRDEINGIEHTQIDPNWIPADKVAPEHTAPGTTVLSGAKPPLIPTQYKIAATIGAGVLTALVVLKKLHII